MRLYCNRVEIFDIWVSFIGIGLYIGQLGRALQTLPQQESHHLKLVGAGVVERTVVHSTALYIYVSRPAVAGVVFIASPHRVQCFHVDGLAEAVVQNVLFQSQYIAGVVKLIPYRNELTGLLFQLFQLACALYRGADGLFGQHIRSMRQAGDDLRIMQMNGR